VRDILVVHHLTIDRLYSERKPSSQVLVGPCLNEKEKERKQNFCSPIISHQHHNSRSPNKKNEAKLCAPKGITTRRLQMKRKGRTLAVHIMGILLPFPSRKRLAMQSHQYNSRCSTNDLKERTQNVAQLHLLIFHHAGSALSLLCRLSFMRFDLLILA
jgi:hypothetical protein